MAWDLTGGWELPFLSVGLGNTPAGGSLCHPSSGDISELWGGLGGGSEPLACRQLLAVWGAAQAQGAARGLCSNESGCSEWGPAVTSRGAAVHSSFNEVPSRGSLLCGSVPWPHHCPLCWLGVQDQLHHPQCCAGVQLGGMGAARAARETSLSGGGGLLSCAENAVSGKWPWASTDPHPMPRLAPWLSTIALCPPAHADTSAVAGRWLCWCNPAHTTWAPSTPSLSCLSPGSTSPAAREDGGCGSRA